MKTLARASPRNHPVINITLDRYLLPASGKIRFSRSFSMIIWVLVLSSILAALVQIKSKEIDNPLLVWEKKPVLGYFLLTDSLVEQLRQEQILNDEEIRAISQVARRERQAITLLEYESRTYLSNPALSNAELRQRVAEYHYNDILDAILDDSRIDLQTKLEPVRYSLLVGWIEKQWQQEREAHGAVAPAAARSYSIFATRYDSKGAYGVALPDKCLKFSNAGNHVCDGDGYTVNQGYSVYLSYKKSTAAVVIESGPWNVDDNYWSKANDIQPRRMFRDLAVGMPEAQAAYFNGYNGGRDQFGRKVSAPFGIDLARQVSIDIGLQPGVNDWINVTFLWTDGWSKGSSGSDAGAEVINPIQIAAPKEDGSVVHVVEQGQTLWNIAAAYQVTLQEVLTLNDLTKDSLIFPGEELLIKSVSITPENTSTQTITSTRQVTEVPTLSSTIQPQTTLAAQPGLEDDELIKEEQETLQPDNVLSGFDPLLLGIVAVFLLGVFLMLIGLLMRTKS